MHVLGIGIDLRNHFPFLQIVSHQHHNGLAAKHKVQHGWPVAQVVPQLLAEEVDVNQVLQSWLANHANAQLLPYVAAGPVSCYQVLSMNWI